MFKIPSISCVRSYPRDEITEQQNLVVHWTVENSKNNDY